MKAKQIILIATLTIFSLTSFGQDNSKPKNIVPPNENSNKSELLVDLKNIDRIEKLFIKQEPSWLTKYGTALVAIVALIGTIVTTTITNRRSRLNTEIQLKASKDNLSEQIIASERNLQSQIDANRIQEIEKRSAELQFKLKNELKETVAKFINAATKLNSKLTYIIYSELEEGRRREAEDEYSKTYILRNELTDLYYSIKVTLDGSQKQRELERIIDTYMNVTSFDFNLDRVNAEDYEQLVGQLFHKIKSIIHENYAEPA
jgi:hypothetical protein